MLPGESLNKSPAAEQRIFSLICAVQKVGNTSSIPLLSEPSAEEKSLVVSSCRFVQRFPSMFGENLFDDFFTDPFEMMAPVQGSDPLYGKHARNLMKTDVRELDNTYELDVDLPGFKKDEITVDLKNGYLTIGASKGLGKGQQDENGKYIRRERYAGVCSRSFYVGDTIRPEDIGAQYGDGILKLSVPKVVRKELPESTSITIL